MSASFAKAPPPAPAAVGEGGGGGWAPLFRPAEIGVGRRLRFVPLWAGVRGRTVDYLVTGVRHGHLPRPRWARALGERPLVSSRALVELSPLGDDSWAFRPGLRVMPATYLAHSAHWWLGA